MALWRRLRNLWWRQKLAESRFGYLFDPEPAGEWVAIDCETTGLDPGRDELLSVAAIPGSGDCIHTSRALRLVVRPEGPVDEHSITIHRLRPRDVAGGIRPREALERLLPLIGSRALVGYYLEFDVAMLERYLRPWLGIGLPNRRVEVSALYHDKRIGLIPQKPVDLRFNTILDALDIPRLGEHDAYNDALMTAMAYVKLGHLRRV